MATRLLNVDVELLKKARYRREMHVDKLEAIFRCLTILLDTELVEFAITGRSPTRRKLNDTIHLNIAEYSPSTLDLFDRVDELFVSAKPPAEDSSNPVNEPVGEAVAEVVDKSVEASGKPKEGNAVTSCQPQMDKLLDLFRPNADGVGFYARPGDTMPMEVAVDNHLSRKAQMRGKSTKDLHSIMAYMQKVQPLPTEEGVRD